MFLRSLTLRGFKSFAEKTTLEFAPGISVIVGPNGSGKSNLVDAISWVLGEQGPSALRGGAMADVIFAGSPARAGLGMAQVHLVIDNSAGIIPVDLTELEISRTIFRSGESEYRIGKQVCRLLDIQELLSEGGIGRALHTVVGQGNLEDVLTARPEDRRQYVEEAAGIAKHRRRKERAERKLGSLEQDLLRLQDVLAELRRQLKPLRQQAEMAKRHEKLTTEADELAWRVAAARLRSLRTDRDARRSGWEEGLARRKTARERLEALDTQLGELAAAREAADRSLEATEGAYLEAEQEKLAAEQALRHAVQEEAEARSRRAAVEAGSGRLAALRSELTRAEVSLRETHQALEVKERELEAAEQAFRARERARLDAEEERRRLNEEAATHRAELETVRRSLSSYERERRTVEDALEQVRRRIEDQTAERDRLEEQIEGLDAEETPFATRQAAIDAERHGLANQVEALEEDLRRLEIRRDLTASRLEELQESPGARFLRTREGRTIGLLRDLVHARPGLERALGAALGPLADAVVYEEQELALKDVRKAEGAVLAVTRTDRSEPPTLLAPTLLAGLDIDQRAQGLVSALLAEVYLAQSIDEAAASHRDHPDVSFVTRDGVLIGPGTIRTDVAPDTGAKALRDELRTIDRDLASAEATLAPKRARLEELNEEAAGITATLEGLDTRITRAAERMGSLATDLASVAKEEELLVERLGRLDESAGAWRESLQAPRPAHLELPSLPPHPEPPLTLRVEVETLRRERSRLESTLSRLREEREELGSAEPAALEEAVRTWESARATAETRLETAAGALAEATAARNSGVAADREATDAEREANREWREAAAELESLREAYEEDDRLRGELERRVDEAERLIREGHEMDPEQALVALAEDDTVDSLSRRSDLVSRRLALLGRVNLLAEGEFGALQERHDFMARELDDVRKARRDLLEVIRQVDEQVITLFDAAFRDVATEFEALFAELFPGGEGNLVLTDPADLLHTGIEIEARPGRKRVKRISLLSGGERALTALGFLFAIFRARPSPFYLLDEVEAALDDVNLHRFLGLIKDFARTSQVLLVTHQKRTMEAADMLYGVSMSRDGSSTVVSQKLEGTGEAKDVVVEVPESEQVS